VDFYVSALKLAIELDGPIHDDRRRYDLERDGVLRRRGIRIIRFSNAEVLTQLEAVLKTIVHAARDAQNPSRPPP
jgi:very-short-patch-repair endonuclease